MGVFYFVTGSYKNDLNNDKMYDENIGSKTYKKYELHFFYSKEDKNKRVIITLLPNL